MMDGKNCTGRRISLLNDSSDVALHHHPLHSKIHLPPLVAHSRDSSSCASTPSLSPQTPQLSRSNSSDSRTLASPSPLTPSLNSFESAHHSQQSHHQKQQYFIQNQAYAKMDEQNAGLYPPIPDATGMMQAAYPIPQMPPQQMQPQPGQQVYRTSNSPQSEPSRVSTVSATSNQKAPPKKNQYPCPMAKQVGCTDFFTTSGHAARHAKKHTGKKDAFCPECNKAFTRKDNMEQHRRTHQNGRGAARSGNANNSDDAKVKKATKPSKKSGVKADSQMLEAAVEQTLAEPIAPIQIPLSAQVAQAAQAQAVQQQALEQALLPPNAGGPYFLNTTDPGPIPALPNVMPDLNIRPQLQRSNFATSLDYVPPLAPIAADPDALHYSYPSPGLSNGLNSLALAASEHRRISEEKSQSQSPGQSPAEETPSEQI